MITKHVITVTIHLMQSWQHEVTGISLVYLHTLLNFWFGVCVGMGREDDFGEWSGKNSTSYSSVDTGGDERVRGACWVADCEPTLASHDLEKLEVSSYLMKISECKIAIWLFETFRRGKVPQEYTLGKVLTSSYPVEKIYRVLQYLPTWQSIPADRCSKLEAIFRTEEAE